MKQYLDDLELNISGVSHSILDSSWNTESFRKPFRVLPHSRIYFPVKGSGKVVHGKEIYSLEKGRMLLIPAYAQVHVSCPQMLEKYWCHFNANLGDSTLDLFFLNQKCIELTLDDFDFVHSLFRRLTELCLQSDPVKQYEFHTGIKLILARFLAHVSWAKDKEMLPVFTKLLLYINSHLHEELSLKVLAAQMGICRSHLSSVFHKKIGMRLSEYINMHRMYKAMCLLRETGRSVSEISDQCGFSNVSVFSKAFKRHTLNTPTEFRSLTDRIPGFYFNS